MTTKNYVNEGFQLPNAEGLAYELRERVGGELSTRFPKADLDALIKSVHDYPSENLVPELRPKSDYYRKSTLFSEPTTSHLEIIADGEVLGTLTVVREGLPPFLPQEVTYTGIVPGYQNPATGAEEVTLREERKDGMFAGVRTDNHTAVALTFMDLLGKVPSALRINLKNDKLITIPPDKYFQNKIPIEPIYKYDDDMSPFSFEDERRELRRAGLGKSPTFAEMMEELERADDLLPQDDRRAARLRDRKIPLQEFKPLLEKKIPSEKNLLMFTEQKKNYLIPKKKKPEDPKDEP